VEQRSQKVQLIIIALDLQLNDQTLVVMLRGKSAHDAMGTPIAAMSYTEIVQHGAGGETVRSVYYTP